MNHLKCTCCSEPLSGGLDTFGDVGREMCWTCWSSFMEMPRANETTPDMELFVRETAEDVDWMRI